LHQLRKLRQLRQLRHPLSRSTFSCIALCQKLAQQIVQLQIQKLV
jgi:hypothetical protein